MTGSSNVGSARRAASCTAIEPAILNAISEESTSWYEPSTSSTRTSTIGYPALTPDPSASSIPCSTAGMNSDGTTPPLILLTKSKPSPGAGSALITTWPYWPRPPVWRTKRPSIFSTGRWMVSR
jgi:hypothetical protein